MQFKAGLLGFFLVSRGDVERNFIEEPLNFVKADLGLELSWQICENVCAIVIQDQLINRFSQTFGSSYAAYKTLFFELQKALTQQAWNRFLQKLWATFPMRYYLAS